MASNAEFVTNILEIKNAVVVVAVIFLTHNGRCGWAIRSSQLWQIDNARDNFHNSRSSQEVTLQWKIFLFNQINFTYICESNLINIYHSENFSTNAYVGIILKSCWYNLYIKPADLFNDIFPVCKMRCMETSF